MQDLSSPVVTPSPHSPPARSRSLTLLVAVLAFLLGVGLVVFAAASGYLTRLIPLPAVTQIEPSPPVVEHRPATPAAAAAAINSVEGRLALIEDRMSRVDFQSQAASGNAARAEGLLVAFAARRLIDRGAPLGYVADQLRLRFSDAQPRAVQTVLAFAQQPVTIDQLGSRLDALSPELAVTTGEDSLWDRARHQISNLFIVRRDAAALGSPSARIGRTRLMLSSGRIDQAIDEVERLPGAEAADKWIADARRYDDVQRALDLLETTAMLEPARLHDGRGQAVVQPSPLAQTAPAAEPIEEATAE